MKRNLTKENLLKLSKIDVNGFKVDIQNYIYNPVYDYDYPTLVKKIDETDTHIFYSKVYYFKYHDGSGKYFKETYSNEKNDGDVWKIAHDVKTKVLEESNRFSLKRLQELVMQTN